MIFVCVQAADYFADAASLNKLCEVLGRRLLSTPCHLGACTDDTAPECHATGSQPDTPAAKQPRREGQFHVSSSRTESCGLTTPGQVCMNPTNKLLDSCLCHEICLLLSLRTIF